MQIIKINLKNPSSKTIKIAAEIIKKGGVVIYPTDTIYGIGANALSREAVDKVYRIKERPEGKPLSVITGDIEAAKKYCVLNKKQEEIFKAVLPGPFTLILKSKSAKEKNKPMRHLDRSKDQSENKIQKNKCVFTVFNNTLSVRIPDCKITALLAKELKIPITATSANISGLPGSGDIGKVLKQLENKKSQIDLVLDAGILPEKDPSVIVDLTGKSPKIIRK